MNLSRMLARRLTANALIVAFLCAGVTVADTSETYQRTDMPAGVSECWNPDTAQISTVVGACPR